MKIASLYAAATEYVAALGLTDQLVAISHECDFPESIVSLPRVTKTVIDPLADSAAIHEQVRAVLKEGKSLYEIDFHTMKNLGVDTIITQEQCGVCAVSPKDLEGLSQALGHEVRVLSLNPSNFQSVLEVVLKVGEFLGASEKAEELLKSWKARVEKISRETRKQCALTRTLVIEWLAPPMVAGHWTAEMVALAGGAHDLNLEGPAKTISWQDVVDFNPQLIVVIPCGFGLERAITESQKFFEKPEGWDQISAVKGGRVYACDGLAYFNRSGPRLVDSLELMGELIHPEKFAGWFQDRPRRQAAKALKL